MRSDLLHVVAVYSNPVRWQNRRRVHAEFEQHMLDSGVKLTTVECAFGERPWELEDHPDINRVRVRAKTVVWTKENLINVGISRLPEGWKYVAWIDADVFFRKPGWAAETVQQLQHYEIVQPWSDAYDLGPNDEHLQAHKSFTRLWWQGEPIAAEGKPNFWKFDGGPYEYAHTGYAWAATRQAIDWLGGLFELGAMGAADYHMALALLGKVESTIPSYCAESYKRSLRQWQERALLHINGNVGFCWGTLEHRWHGRKNDRKYIDRWQMIMRHGFDPETDLKRNSWGVLELAGNKPGLTHDMMVYFSQRNEDANTIT